MLLLQRNCDQGRRDDDAGRITLADPNEVSRRAMNFSTHQLNHDFQEGGARRAGRLSAMRNLAL